MIFAENLDPCIDESATATLGPVSFTWGTYYGQSINSVFNDVKIDNSGNIYAFGSTISQGFDGVLVKFDVSGALIWERLIGGADADNFNSDDNFDYGKLAVGADGNIYVTGITQSDDFPVLNAFQPNRAGSIDAYVAKFDSDGNMLMSSFLGGSANENLNGSGDIAVDADGNIFVTGSTLSEPFFDNSSASQSTFSGGVEPDIFVVKISQDFSTIVGSYWGSEGVDISRGIEIDNSGNVWVGGASRESDLVLPGNYSNAFGGLDAVLLGWSNDLSQLTNGTFLGGIFDEEICDLITDNDGNIFLTGGTFSTNDFPIANAFQGSYQGGQMAFVSKVTPNGNLIWSTFLGGSQNEIGKSIAIDTDLNVYVSGVTASRDFPDFRAAQATYNDWTCADDGFVFKFNADGSQDWATYYGGWREEVAAGIEVNNSGQVVVVGKTKSIDLPTSVGAYKEESSFAGINAFVATFEIACPSTPIIIHSKEDALYHDQFWCNNYFNADRNHFKSDTCALQLIAPPGYINYDWFLNGNSFNATGQIINVANPGNANNIREYHVAVSDGIDCLSTSTSTSVKLNWVRPMCGFGSSFNEDELPHKSNILEGYDNEFVCLGDPISEVLTADAFCESSFQWQRNFEDIPGAINSNFTVTEPGCYRLALKNEFTGCVVYSRSKKFIVLDSLFLNDYYAYRTDEECERIDTLEGCSSVYLKARLSTCDQCGMTPNGITYQWERDGNPISGGANGALSTSVEGVYTVRVSSGGCEIVTPPVQVLIRPTERPEWVFPTSSSVCIHALDSIALTVTHPAVNDSSTIRFNLPSPATDIVGYDSSIVFHDPVEGCVNVNLTRLDGCTSTSPSIEFHDTLSVKLAIDGPACLPVRLSMIGNYSCTLDTMIWMFGDSVVRKTSYRSSYTATMEGDFHCLVKNACGVFSSDTVSISGNLDTPGILPTGPVCLPANVTLDFPNPDSSIIIHWYRNTSANGCNTSAQYLIPNENDLNLVASQPGFYFAILEDTITGCKSLCSDKVEVQQSAAGSSLNPSSNVFFCDGDGTENVTFSINQSSSTFDYQWYRNGVAIPGEINPSYTTNQEGVYRVFLENACDNAFTPTVSIYNIPNPTLEINQPDTIYLCGPDTIRLPTSFDQPVIFQWYFNDVEIIDAVDSFYLATTPGKYQVHGINNNSKCEDWSKEIYILDAPPLDLQFDTTPNCSGTCSGEVEVSVFGGVPYLNGSYNILWSNSETASTITGLCNGVFYVTIEDAVGCNIIDSIVVDEGFTITTSVDSVSCFAASDGAISIAVNGGVEPFQYLWNSGDTILELTNLDVGNYAITITDSIGCEKQETYQIAEPSELTLILSKTDVLCIGDSNGSIQALVSGGTGPYDFVWNSPLILDSNMLAAGFYEVTLTDKNNCQLVDSIRVDEPSALDITFMITNELGCNDSKDGSINANPVGGVGPYQFLWENGSSAPSRSNLSADTYYLTITDVNNCSFSDSIMLIAPQALALVLDEEKNIDCNLGADGYIHLSAQGGTAPFEFFLNGVSTTDGIYNNLSAGWYDAYVSDSSNCSSANLMIEITQPDSINIQVNTTAVICPGTSTGTADLVVSGGTGNYQYNWSNGFVGAMNSSLAQGVYEVAVSDSNSCEKIITFEITSQMPLNTDFLVDDVKCFSENQGKISIVQTTGGTAPYEYYLEGNALSANNQNLDSLYQGTYFLKTVDAQNCEIIDTILVDEPVQLIADLLVLDSLLCQGAEDGVLSVSASGGVQPYLYTWENGTQDSFNIDLHVGNYVVTVRDANDCQIVKQINLPDGPFLELLVSGSMDVSCWGENDGSFTVEPQGGTAPFQYHFDQQVFADGNFEDLSEGSYQIYITDVNNCISANHIVDVVMPDKIELEVVSTPVLCPGENSGTAEILVQGGVGLYGYSWSNNTDTSIQNNLIAGMYSVVVNDENNCLDTIEFEITQPAPISVDFEIDHVSCFGESDGLVKVIFENGGTAPYVHSLNQQNFSNTDLSFQGLSANTYSVITIDDNGCEHIEELTISEPDVFDFNLVEEQIVELGNNAEIVLNIQNGVGVINYVFNPTNYLDCPSASISDCATPTAILPIDDIVYEVTIVDENGCSAINGFKLNVINPDENIYLGNAFNLNSESGNDMFYIQANAAVENIVKFQIFNRWGAQVFEQANFSPNDKSNGWNGIFNGQQVDVGVYIYAVEYRTIDGKVKKKMGDVVVLK